MKRTTSIVFTVTLLLATPASLVAAEWDSEYRKILAIWDHGPYFIFDLEGFSSACGSSGVFIPRSSPYASSVNSLMTAAFFNGWQVKVNFTDDIVESYPNGDCKYTRSRFELVTLAQ